MNFVFKFFIASSTCIREVGYSLVMGWVFILGVLLANISLGQTADQSVFGDSTAHSVEAQNSQQADKPALRAETEDLVPDSALFSASGELNAKVYESNPIAQGISPIMLLQEDLDYFSANKAVGELLRAFISNANKNRFVTVDQALGAIDTELRQIDGLSDALLLRYQQTLRPYIATVYLSYSDSSADPKTPIGKTEVLPVTTDTPVFQRYQLQIGEKQLDAVFPSLPAELVSCLDHIKNVNYPSLEALSAALNTMLNELKRIAESKDTSSSCKLSDPSIIEELVGSANQKYSKNVIEKVLPQAQKKFYASDMQALTLQALPECSECSRPFNGVNYGFYPFWMASNTYLGAGLPSVNPGYLNFSVFTRIAYLGLPINDKGELSDLLHWANPSLLRDFIGTLKQYNVDRDIVLYTSNWEAWGAAKSSQADANTIRDKVYAYAENHYRKLTELNESVDDYGGLNGVTLYFDNYHDSSDVSNLVNYVTHMSTLIRADSNEYSAPWLEVNLLLGLRGLSSDRLKIGLSIAKDDPNFFIKISNLFINYQKNDSISDAIASLSEGQSFDSRSAMSNLVDNEPTIVKHVLVFLQEDTSTYKKKLRMQVENEFNGEERAAALLKIVPVLGRLTRAEEATPYRQYTDDIVYLKYNFGGIGIGNLPLTGIDGEGKIKSTNTEMRIFNDVLKLPSSSVDVDYLNHRGLGVIGGILHAAWLSPYVSLCGFACPHRSWGVPILFLLVAVNLLAAILVNTHCKSRQWILSMHPVYPGLKISVVLLLLIMLGCDPYWQPWADLILASLVLAFLGFSGLNLFGRMVDKSYENY